MRNYIGHRAHDKTCRVHVWEDGALVKLDPRLDLWNHSPDGFNWGYHGSGPAQLALAILADALGDDSLACLLYQHFKRCQIAPLQHDHFVLTGDNVRKWALAVLAEELSDKEALDTCLKGDIVDGEKK